MTCGSDSAEDRPARREGPRLSFTFPEHAASMPMAEPLSQRAAAADLHGEAPD